MRKEIAVAMMVMLGGVASAQAEGSATVMVKDQKLVTETGVATQAELDAILAANGMKAGDAKIQAEGQVTTADGKAVSAEELAQWVDTYNASAKPADAGDTASDSEEV